MLRRSFRPPKKRKGPAQWYWTGPFCLSRLWCGDVFSLIALWSLFDLELDHLAFVQCLVSVHLDGGAFVADAPTGERGILAVTGPTLSPGYVDERLSSELFVRNMPDGRVWASTGDLGTVDADGYIWVYGREKDLIIRAGGNIDPKLIEEVLAHHPAVLLSAAIGRPDAMKGELPIVYVQLKDGAQATPDEILTFCRNHMTERAAIPVEAIILPIMPMTAVAKIAKPVLRLDAMQRVVTEVAKSVIGSNRRTNVTIDESGKRPAAIIEVEVEPADREGALKRLRDAYAGFAFKTDIQLMEV